MENNVKAQAEFAPRLGQRVVDKLTLFNGWVTCRAEDFGGTVRYLVESFPGGSLAEKWLEGARLQDYGEWQNRPE